MLPVRMDSYSAFKEILADQNKWEIFSIFLERDQSSENGIFYMKVEKFKSCATSDEAQKIYDAHLRPNSKQQINIDANLSAKIYHNIQSSTITSDLFQEVQLFILKLIFTSSYERFIRNSIFFYIIPLFSDNIIISADNQPILNQISVSVKNLFCENTEWNILKPKRKDFDICYKEKSITGTNYGLMKAELTDLIDADPLTILSWLVSFNQEKKEWDRQFMSGSVEQVITKNTFICKLSFAYSSIAMLFSWNVFDDGSIILVTVDVNHNKIESTDTVSYDKEKVLAYYLQPSANKQQSKISIFLKQKLGQGCNLPKEEMISSSRCDQIKRLAKHLRSVWKGKYKGPLPVAVANLFQFPPPHLIQYQLVASQGLFNSNSVGMSLNSPIPNSPSSKLSDGMPLDKPVVSARVRTISLESPDKVISKDARDTTSKDSSTMSLADSRSQKDVTMREKEMHLSASTCYKDKESSAHSGDETRTKSRSKSLKSRRIEELHDHINPNDAERRINDLEKENESLKQQVLELKKVIARYENK